MSKNTTADTAALKALSFRSLFAADLKPERIEFEMQGQTGFVELRKFNFGTAEQYKVVGVKFRQKAGSEDEAEITDLDQEARNRFLLSRTVSNWLLFIPGPDGSAQATPAPEGKRDRELWWEKFAAELDPDFGEWLSTECLRVNGLLKDQEKNSPSPSSN